MGMWRPVVLERSRYIGLRFADAEVSNQRLSLLGADYDPLAGSLGGGMVLHNSYIFMTNIKSHKYNIEVMCLNNNVM